MFAFNANPVRQPPDSRVKEEDRFDHALHHVHEMIATPQMSQLVSQHRLDLFRCQAARQRQRQEDGWLQDSNHGWNGNPFAICQRRPQLQSQCLRLPLQRGQ